MMTVKTFAWTVLLVAAGRVDPQRARLPRQPRAHAGLHRHGLHGRVVRGGGRHAHLAAGPRRRGPPGPDSSRGTSRTPSASTRRSALLIDPLAVFMMLVVSGVSTLIHLYAVSYMGSDRGYTRFFSYLNFFVFSMLLLVLAGNFVLLIIGWAFVGAASYLLISFWFRRETATRAGIKAFVINVRRRRRPRARDVLHLPQHGDAELPRRLRPGARRLRPQRRRPHRRPAPAARRRVREVRPGAAAHLAPGRHGGPDPGLRPDPRGDDGHRGRLPHRAHVAAVRDHARGRRGGRRDRRADDVRRRDDRASRRPT